MNKKIAESAVYLAVQIMGANGLMLLLREFFLSLI